MKDIRIKPKPRRTAPKTLTALGPMRSVILPATIPNTPVTSDPSEKAPEIAARPQPNSSKSELKKIE